MEQHESIEMQLWDYIDGHCTPADAIRIAQLIATDEVWRQHYETLSEVHAATAHSMETEQPSLRFSKNVMDAISKAEVAPAAVRYINTRVIKGIAAAVLAVIGSVLGYALLHTDWTVTRSTTSINLPNMHAADLLNSGYFNMLIAVNVVLGLVILDKVLRGKART
ncbi:MAG: hypothetical protein V4649_05995 [Bacteroidota bacterium]